MKKYTFLLCLISLSPLQLHANNNYVSWDWGGRTGDQLLSYCVAKWVSHNFTIPLLIKPFKYSDQFVFSRTEEQLTSNKMRSLKVKNIGFGHKGRIVAYDSDFEEHNTLFTVDLLFAHANWYRFNSFMNQNTMFPYALEYDSSFCDKGDISWQARFNYMHQVFKADTDFFIALKASLQPVEPIKIVDIPAHAISVAVHVRKGGGFDAPYKSDQVYATALSLDHYHDYFAHKNSEAINEAVRASRKKKIVTAIENKSAAELGYHDIVLPLKHAPDQYYIDQIKALDALLGLPLFVFIFTDDQSPRTIVERYRSALPSKNITFAYRTEENNHYSNVLDDMFSMVKFDVLIRSSSSFSQVAQLLGNHKLVISPMHALWHGNKLIIDEVLVEKSDDFEDFIATCKQKYQ